MRIIKFRGKDIETGEWIYGHFFQRSGHYPAIVEPRPCNGKVMYFETAVSDETVGQFTGLYDKNGEEIYEGDILRIEDHANVVCEFRYGAFGYIYYTDFHPFAANTNYTFNPKDTDNHWEVVGNIYDNPDLYDNPGSV